MAQTAKTTFKQPCVCVDKEEIKPDATTILEENLSILRNLNARLKVSLEIVYRIGDRVRADLTGEKNNPSPEKEKETGAPPNSNLSALLQDYENKSEQLLNALESLSGLV